MSKKSKEKKQEDIQYKTKVITIDEYDYRVKYHNVPNLSTLEYRFNETADEILGLNLDESCYKWKRLTEEGICEFTINQYCIFFDWLINGYNYTVETATLRHYLPFVPNDEWFSYYIKASYNLRNIKSIMLKEIITGELQDKVGGNSKIWDEMIDIYSSCNLYNPKEKKEFRKKIIKEK